MSLSDVAFKYSQGGFEPGTLVCAPGKDQWVPPYDHPEVMDKASSSGGLAASGAAQPTFSEVTETLGAEESAKLTRQAQPSEPLLAPKTGAFFGHGDVDEAMDAFDNIVSVTPAKKPGRAVDRRARTPSSLPAPSSRRPSVPPQASRRAPAPGIAAPRTYSRPPVPKPQAPSVPPPPHMRPSSISPPPSARAAVPRSAAVVPPSAVHAPSAPPLQRPSTRPMPIPPPPSQAMSLPTPALGIARAAPSSPPHPSSVRPPHFGSVPPSFPAAASAPPPVPGPYAENGGHAVPASLLPDEPTFGTISQPPRRRKSSSGLFAIFLLLVIVCGALGGVYLFQPALFERSVNRIRGLLGQAPATQPEKVQGPPFDAPSAGEILGRAAGEASSCSEPSGPVGKGRAQVLYGPDGSATSVAVSEPFHQTSVGKCLIDMFMKTKVPPFGGDPVIVSKTFDVQ